MTYLQNIVGCLEKKYRHCNMKWKVLMANYKKVEFIEIMQRLIDKFTTFL